MSEKLCDVADVETAMNKYKQYLSFRSDENYVWGKINGFLGKALFRELAQVASENYDGEYIKGKGFRWPKYEQPKKSGQDQITKTKKQMDTTKFLEGHLTWLRDYRTGIDKQIDFVEKELTKRRQGGF